MSERDSNLKSARQSVSSGGGRYDEDPVKASKDSEGETMITFQLQFDDCHGNLEPSTTDQRTSFTVPLRLAMDASPVLEADFENLTIHRKHHHVVIANANPEAFALLMQYMYRNKPSKARKYTVTEGYPKIKLWIDCYMIAVEFKVAGLKKYVIRRIKEKLLELEETGVLCDEYMMLVKFVDNERKEVSWLREIIVDVKRVIARRDRNEGLSLENELPNSDDDWRRSQLPYNSSDFEDSEDA